MMDRSQVDNFVVKNKKKTNISKCEVIQNEKKTKITARANQIIINHFGSLLTFFLSMLKLSIITPIKRLRVKKEPHTMKMTK